MNSLEPIIRPPHFAIVGAGPEASSATDAGDRSPRDVGPLALRAAECLAAALLECTVEAGLNEARYRVLAALHRRAGGECSQSELAELLLQSESNLSTLLERMSADGLLSRTRSQTDRRRSLIRMTPSGLGALERAERARGATLARLMREFAPQETEQLVFGLRRLISELENALDVAVRRRGGSIAATGPSPPRPPTRAGRGPADPAPLSQRDRHLEAHSS